MPKNPYHRVDALSSGRHIQVLVNGEPLATTRRPALIIETGVPPRWYIPPGDVRWDRLTPSPHHTTCQYKGQAHYWTVDGTDPPLPVWSYLEPLPEAATLAGLIGIPDDDPWTCQTSRNSPSPTQMRRGLLSLCIRLGPAGIGRLRLAWANTRRRFTGLVRNVVKEGVNPLAVDRVPSVNALGVTRISTFTALPANRLPGSATSTRQTFSLVDGRACHSSWGRPAAVEL